MKEQSGARPIFSSVAGGAPRPWLNALRLLSLADGLLLVALLYVAVSHNEPAVDVLGPAHGVLFLALLAGIGGGARNGWWTWLSFVAVAILGPLASVPGLERLRRRR